MSTKTETPAELEATQSVFPRWMREACEGASMVKVTRKHTPWGTVVVSVEVVA